MSKKLDSEQIIDLFYNKNKTKQDICDIINVSITTLLKFCKNNSIILDTNFIKSEDIADREFGRLIAIRRVKNDRFGKSYWLCKCQCGKEKEIAKASLIRGLTLSCGCYQIEKAYRGCGDVSGMYWKTTRNGAARRNIEFNITVEDMWNQFLKQEGKCIYTGLQLTLTKRYNRCRNQTASIDRIDSSKGYTKDNIQWVHKDINRMKQEYEEEYFIKMCQLVADKSRENK